MDNVTIKQEKVDNANNTETNNTSLPDLGQLLEELKREDELEEAEQAASRVAENPNGSKVISSDSNDDDEIEKLQELLKEKQKLLEETEALEAEKSPERSDNSGQKRKKHGGRGSTGCESTGSARKRSRRYSRASRSKSKSPTKAPSAPAEEPATLTPKIEPLPVRSSVRSPTLEEMEQILKAEDNSSDEEPLISINQPVLSSVQQTDDLPLNVDLYQPCNQMQNAFLPGAYPPIYYAGSAQPFFPGSMEAQPSAGFGFPNIPAEQDELECLPVVNSAGFTGMPTFRRIKLERNPETTPTEAVQITESPADRLLNIFRRCTSLLDELDIQEPTGKFIYTPTVSKLKPGDRVVNSVLQKITNVDYEFHSIGPKLNISDWGLREIGSCNADVAKKIAISAEVYFTKIVEKAETMARKLITLENAEMDVVHQTIAAEEEEPTLSSFFKNSMVQTDPVICRDCAARNRIRSYDIGVQAVVFKSSIGSQTGFSIDPYSQLSAGLNGEQLRALHAFSDLIRDSGRGLSYEQYQHRANNLFGLIQRRHPEPHPPPHHMVVPGLSHLPPPAPAYPTHAMPQFPPTHMNTPGYQGHMQDPRLHQQHPPESLAYSRIQTKDPRKSYGRGNYRQ